MESTIRSLEESLRSAMLRSDIDALDTLLADGLIFVGAQGEVLRKEDDLELHRSGRLELTKAEWRCAELADQGHSAVSLVTADLAGSIDGSEFTGTFRYCRFWVETGAGWRVVGGSVVALGDEGC
ncbi:nuclear transport factor 2 family protein [Luteimonas sp. SDU82]|uniref:nuclear transport factor 2 family protein n=1 Tax=Luteimonas sp. SDU82 TaxID=3422592 RepID=UPI003EC099B9